MGEKLGVFLGNPRLQGLPAVLERPGRRATARTRRRSEDEGAARPLDARKKKRSR